ncbi:MAG: histidine kinase dimerization/phospho-acceptor domain-containing protein [Terriglobia bacterium]
MRATEPGQQTSAPVRILTLGADADCLECLRRSCAEAGSRFRLQVAPSLNKAWPLLSKGQVDVLLCDLEGFVALLRRRSRIRDTASSLPVLVLVAPGQEQEARGLLGHIEAEFVLYLEGRHEWLWAWVERARARRPRAPDELGHIVRHEINNPLTGVLGNAELALAESPTLPGETRRRLETIVRLAVKMRGVVDSLQERLPSVSLGGKKASLASASSEDAGSQDGPPSASSRS